MKKIILILILLVFLTGAKSVLAESSLNVFKNSSNSARETAKTSVEGNLTDNLKKRAQTEITRRLNFLNELVTKISGLKKLSDADKSSLQTQVQTQITGLTALQTKINSDTDLTTLRTDVKSIVSDYYIFLFFRVKINLLIASDKAFFVTDSLTAISTKLKTRIDEASSNGKDVTSLNTLLTDMNSKISDAKTLITAAQTEVAALNASGYPGNKSTLLDARTKLKTAATDLRTAFQDGQKIRQGLGEKKDKDKNSTSSALQKLSPIH